MPTLGIADYRSERNKAPDPNIFRFERVQNRMYEAAEFPCWKIWFEAKGLLLNGRTEILEQCKDRVSMDLPTLNSITTGFLSL